MAERSCGACSCCCAVLEVSELGKPAYQRCEHQLAGGGCAIFGRTERPAACAAYACEWLLGGVDGGARGTAFRPDRCGAIADEIEGHGRALRAAFPGGLRQPKARRLVLAARENGASVVPWGWAPRAQD